MIITINSMSAFAFAVLDPFDARANGAQVPDEYSFPTATVTLKQSTTFQSDANGEFDFAILPSPLATLYMSNAATGGTLAAPYGQSLQIQNTYVTKMSGLITAADLVAFKQYRLVGLGVRMRSLLVPLTSTGVLQYVTQPAGDRLLSAYLQINAGVGQGTVIREFMKLPIHDGDGYFGTAIENYKTSGRMEHFAFNRHGLEWNSRPCGPDAFQWRNGTAPGVLTVAADTFYLGDATNLDITAVGTSKNNESAYLTTKDWTTLAIRGNNFPNSVPVLDLEVIMHLEYIDSNVSTVGGNGRFPPVIPGALSHVAAQAAGLPLYRSIAGDTGMQMQSRLGL